MGIFDRFFEDSEVEELEDRNAALESAAQIIAFAILPYYGTYLSWLEREANRPLPVGDHMEMVKAAVRSNTLREIREHLVREVDTAKAIVAEEREGRHV